MENDRVRGIAAEARRTHDEGARIYTPTFVSKVGVGGTDETDEFGLIIEGIEAQGWEFQTWGFSRTEHGRLVAHPVFRWVSEVTAPPIAYWDLPDRRGMMTPQ